jgi:hypothetical protein
VENQDSGTRRLTSRWSGHRIQGLESPADAAALSGRIVQHLPLQKSLLRVHGMPKFAYKTVVLNFKGGISLPRARPRCPPAELGR